MVHEKTIHRFSWRMVLVDAYVVLAVAFMAVCSVVVWHGSGDDINVYRQYAVSFWQHSPRFSSFPLEYPPLSLIPFALTLLPGPDPEIPFGVGMAVVIVGIYAGFVRWGNRRQALIFAAFLLLSEQAMMTTRFDIVPAFLTIGAIWTAERRHWNWAHGLLGLGILMKLYPIFCVPLLLCAEGKSIWRAATAQKTIWRCISLAFAQRLGVLIGIVGAGLSFVQWRSPGNAFLFITYAAQRPVQVESTLGMLTWLGGLLGIPFKLDLGYGSVNWSGPLAGALLPWTLPTLAIACVMVYLWYVRGKMTLPVAFLAVVCVILITNRVFSTQYMIWAAPLVAAAEEWDWAWVALGVLQTAEDALYPYTYPTQSAGDILRFIVVLSMRNIVLIFVTARLFWRYNTQPDSSAAKPAPLAEIAE